MTLPISETQVDPDSSTEVRLNKIPPRTSLLENLSTQTTLLTALFTLLSSTNPNANTSLNQLPPEIQALLSSSSNLSSNSITGNTTMILPTSPNHPIENIYSAIQNTTKELYMIRKHLSEHQEIWNRVEKKKKEVIVLERNVRDLIRNLEKGRKELEGLVMDGREVIRNIGVVETAPIQAPSLLAHAHALSKHSSAPISSLLTPIDKAAYMPWPTESSMRMGLLFQLQGSMSGVGEIGQMGAKEDIEMADATAAPASQMVEVHREDYGRRYDPEAVYSLDLNSDSEDD